MGTSKQSKLLVTAAVAGTMGLWSGVRTSSATIITWVGGSSNNFLETPSNWSPTPAGTDLTSGVDDVVFSGGSSLTPTISTGVWFDGMSINNSAASPWTIDRSGTSGNSQALTIGSAGVTATGSGSISWKPVTTVIKSAQTWDIASGVTIATDASAGFSFASKLTKAGAGTLLLQGTSSGAGGIEVQQGILAITNSATPVGTSGITVDDGATLSLASGSVIASASVTLNGGATIISSGTGTGLDAASPITLAADHLSVTLSTGAATTDTFRVLNAVVGAGSSNVVNVSGSGMLSLEAGSNAANAFAGTWKINSSATVLVYDLFGLGNPGGAASSFNVQNSNRVELAGGTLAAAGSSGGGSQTMNFNNAISVSASSSILIATTSNSGGATTLISSVSRKFSTLAIGSSTLTIGLFSAAGSPYSVTGGATAGSPTDVGFTTTTLYGSPTFNVTGTTATTGVNFAGALTESGGSYGITKSGGGYMNMASPGAYSGGTTVTGGQLSLGFFPTSGLFTTSGFALANGATLTIGDSSNHAYTVDSGKFISGTGTLQANGGTGVTLAMAGVSISPGGTGTVGTLTLTASSSTSSLKAISLSASGTANSLNIDVAGTAAGQYDQLVLSAGKFLGSFADTNLVISTGAIPLSTFKNGQLLTIISGPGINFANLGPFLSVKVDGITGNSSVVYRLNEVVIAIPEPTSFACFGFLVGVLLKRDRRRSL